MPRPASPVAIVGLSCRFPGGPTKHAFWDLLTSGGNAIDEVAPTRWNLDALRQFNDGKPVPANVTRGGWLPEVRQFDNVLFRMSPREAKMLDPKQRMVLAVTHEAFEDANLSPQQLREQLTGVYLGTAQSEYLMRFYNRMEIGTARSDRYVGPGNDPSFSSGRISATFGLEGPSINVNTACSTSLVAVQMAMTALASGECDVAVAGGVAIIESPEHSLTMNQFGVLAPDSQCKAFDASADGYVRAEGCGMIVLRRLDDALAHGDRIYAVLRGGSVNHNGLSDNIMAPDTGAQARLVSAALDAAGVEPSTIDYVEAHGTGTAVGDPIEMNAMIDVFGGTGRTEPIHMGSVKTNVGHLEVGAGIAGLIKTVLALHHRTLPAHLHLSTLNPRLPADLPFSFPTQTTPWPAPDGRPRRAVVNSYGIAGTNASVVVEEAPAPADTPQVPARPRAVLPLSAFGGEPLAQLAGRYADHLEAGADLHATAHTAATGRDATPTRAAVVAHDAPTAVAALRALASGGGHEALVQGDARGEVSVAMLFTGQGAQRAGMGRDLYASEPVFASVIDDVDARCQPLLGRSLKAVMWGDDPEADVGDTTYTQPALFAFELAVATLWQSWGVVPSLMIGHSIGELVAAHLAGVFTLDDALKLVCARGKLMGALPTGGAMAALFAPASDVSLAVDAQGGRASIAADNGPTSTTISGEAEAVEAVCAAFEARDVGVRRLTVSHAFHSALMDPMLEAFRELAASIPMQAPTRPIMSNVTGTLGGAEMATADYWVKHVRGTVRFRDNVEAIAARKIGMVIEVGPDAALIGQARRCIRQHRATWLASVRKDDEAGTLANAVAQAWCSGAAVRWAGYWADHRTERIELPRYPYQNRPFWVDDPGPPTGQPATAPAAIAPAAAPTAHTFDRPDAYRMKWTAISGWSPRASQPGTWIVGLDAGGVLEPAAAALEAAGHTVIRAVPATKNGASKKGRHGLIANDPQGYRDLVSAQGEALRGWLHGWALDAPADCPDAAAWTASQDTASLSAMFVAAALAGSGPAGAASVMVTAGADAVHPGESPALAQAPVWGVMRVVSLEHRDLPNVRIDLDPTDDDHGAAALATLVAELPADEDQLALRRGRWHALRMVPHTASGEPLRPTPGGAWIVTGGLGALGLAVGRWLADQGATHVILCGRSKPKPAAQAAIDAMKAGGVEVLVESVDVSDPTQVHNLVRYVTAKGVPITGVVHAAGVLSDGPVLKQTTDSFYKVFPAKVGGAWNLHTATRHLHLDAFVLFSSVSSSLGAPGQVNYAAANAFMDALAWRRHAEGLPAVSINWGPWGEIGMAAKLSALMASRGMGGLPTADGLGALGSLGADLLPQVSFMDMKLPTLVKRDPAIRQAPLFRTIIPRLEGTTPAPATKARTPAPAPSAPAPTTAAGLLDRLAATPIADRQAALGAALTAMAASQLGVPAGELSSSRPLAWQGFDSVMALDLHRDIEAQLGVALDLQAVTVGPSVDELAGLVWPALTLPSQVVDLPAARTAPVASMAPGVPMPAADRPAALTAQLAAWSETLLGVDPGGLDIDRPLAWQGFDSVMALDLQRRIHDETGVDLPLDTLAQGPKLAEVVEILLPLLPADYNPHATPAPQPAAAPAPTPAGLHAAIAAAREVDRAAVLAVGLAGFAEELLGVDPGGLDVDRPLAWQGFDSVMALDLQRRIHDALGVDLPLDALAQGPKLSEVVELVLPSLDLTAVVAAPAAPVAAGPPPSSAAADTGDLRARLAAQSAEAQQTTLLAALTSWAEALLGADPGDVEASRPLAWQGFDSVMALDLQRRIFDETGVDLPLDTLAQGPRLLDVVAELQPRLDLTGLPTTPATPASLAAAPQAPSPAAPAPALRTVQPRASEAQPTWSDAAPTDDEAAPGGVPPFAWLLLGLLGASLIYVGATGMSDGASADDGPRVEQNAGRRGKGRKAGNP